MNWWFCKSFSLVLCKLFCIFFVQPRNGFEKIHFFFFFLMDLRVKCLVKDFLFGFVCLLSLDVGDRGWWVPNGVGGTCLVTQGESCDLEEFLV